MWGFHLILDIDKCNENVTIDYKILSWLEELMIAIEIRPYGPPLLKHFAEHEPQATGYSLVQLIETSAICGHFSDLNRDAYLDIFSCAPFDITAAIETTKKHFSPKSINYLYIEREAKFPAASPFKSYTI